MMKWITAFAAFFFFFGCADKDAYSKFGLLDDEERAFDNVKVVQFRTKEKKSVAVMAAVYLNSVYPQRYKDEERFYLLFIPKEKYLLQQLHMKLNGHPVLKLQKLPSQNEYAHLLNMKARWSDFYLASFAKEDNTTLVLHVELANKLFTNVTFEKNR